jgi:hypothetical protein
MTLLTVFCGTVLVLVMALMTLIVVRSLYQMIYDEEGLFYSFLYAATEPVLYPVRSALSHVELFASLPIDFSGVFALLILMLIRMLLTLV